MTASCAQQDDLDVVSLGWVKRLSRRPEQIETLNFHAAVDVPAPGEQRRVPTPLGSRRRSPSSKTGLRDSPGSPSRIRGWVSDQLFGLVAADLGGCKLVKQEDAGVLFYEDEVKLPDWPARRSCRTRTSWSRSRPRTTTTHGYPNWRLAEVARLKSYAELNDCPLYIAVHWVAMSMWTLVPIDDYVRVGDHFEIDLKTAFKRNHMCSLLNDRMLGLKPPLEFRLTMQEVPDEDGATEVERELRRGWTEETVPGDHRCPHVRRRRGDGRQERDSAGLVPRPARALAVRGKDRGRRRRRVGDGVHVAPDESHAEQGFDIIGASERAVYPDVLLAHHLAQEETTKLSIDIEPGTLPRLVRPT